jgi:DNA-binding response OmpR family regulator
MRLLLVEDDAMIGEAVLDALRDEHYAVDWVRDGVMADTALRSESYDLVLLDLGLPKRDGLDVLRSLRARHSAVPVLVATARDAVGDRIAGLDAGADDYVVKPFDTEELLARIRALLRRRARGSCFRAPSSRKSSTAGRTTSAAMPWRSMCMGCARSSAAN